MTDKNTSGESLYRDGILVNLVFNISTKPATTLAFLLAKAQQPIKSDTHSKSFTE